MGTESVRPKPGSVDASGDFPVVDRSVSEERQRPQGWRGSKHRDEEFVVPSPELTAGQIIAGKYRLDRPIGEGGMGRVWIARNEDLDVDVAIKVLRPEARKSVRTQVSERMLVEARAAARLGHPAIVRVLDLGRTADGDPFLVMELLEGENLADVVETRGPLDPVEAVRTLLPIAHAMVAAHEKGIVHRDLKPENILLATQQGGGVQPKLIDFGVAKLASEGTDKITQIGMLVGSPGYMSPEQGRGDPVDARSDVWSFCIVLHELVTGGIPFKKNHPYAVLRSILEDPLPDLEKAGFTDDGLATIVRRGLEKEPEDRWQSMNELGVTLARWLLDRGVFDDICGGSLDVTWLRTRSASIPDDLAAFKARSPSLGALARMREPTSDAAPPREIKEEPRTAGSEVPVAIGAIPVWAPEPVRRRNWFGIAMVGASVALILAGVTTYAGLHRNGSPGTLAPGSVPSTSLGDRISPAEPPRSDVAPASRGDDARPSSDGSRGDAPSEHEGKTRDRGAKKSVAPSKSASAPAASAAAAAPSSTPPAPTPEPTSASPLKRPEL